MKMRSFLIFIVLALFSSFTSVGANPVNDPSSRFYASKKGLCMTTKEKMIGRVT